MVQTFSDQRRVVFGLGWIEHPPEKAQLCVYIPTMYTVPDGAPQSRQLGKTAGAGRCCCGGAGYGEWS